MVFTISYVYNGFFIGFYFVLAVLRTKLVSEQEGEREKQALCSKTRKMRKMNARNRVYAIDANPFKLVGSVPWTFISLIII